MDPLGLLALVLVLPALATGAGECYFNGKASCQHAGTELSPGDTWMDEACYLCVCLKPFGVGCCDNAQQPVDYPPWCEVVQRPQSCRLEVVMKSDPRLPCVDSSAVRRLVLARGAKQEKTPWF